MEKFNLKSNLKKIIEQLKPGNLYTDQHFYKMLNLVRKTGSVEAASMQLLAEMPATKKVYEIEAFLDLRDHHNLPAYTAWDVLAGAEPDRFVVNGRRIGKSSDGRPYLREDKLDRNAYPIHKCSCKRGNLIMHVYTK